MRTGQELQQLTKLAAFGNERFTREERYLKIFARDLQKGFKAISEMGIENARKEQLFFDFQIVFEDLKEKMSEFRWSSETLKENGIDFKAIRKLYFAVA